MFKNFFKSKKTTETTKKSNDNKTADNNSSAKNSSPKTSDCVKDKKIAAVNIDLASDENVNEFAFLMD